MNNLTLFHDLVLITPVEAASKTASGVLIPEVSKQPTQWGDVVAVSPEIKQVKKGDRVLYRRWGDTETEIDNVKYLLVSMEDVFAIKEKTL